MNQEKQIHQVYSIEILGYGAPYMGRQLCLYAFLVRVGEDSIIPVFMGIEANAPKEGMPLGSLNFVKKSERRGNQEQSLSCRRWQI